MPEMQIRLKMIRKLVGYGELAVVGQIQISQCNSVTL
jgi:hypothetical protein